MPFPEAAKLKNDDRIHIKGKLSTIYYQPYNAMIPYVQVESWHSIKQPEEPYVFCGYDN